MIEADEYRVCPSNVARGRVLGVNSNQLKPLQFPSRLREMFARIACSRSEGPNEGVRLFWNGLPMARTLRFNCVSLEG